MARTFLCDSALSGAKKTLNAHGSHVSAQLVAEQREKRWNAHGSRASALFVAERRSKRWKAHGSCVSVQLAAEGAAHPSRIRVLLLV